MRGRLLILVAAICAVLLLAACGDDSGDDTTAGEGIAEEAQRAGEGEAAEASKPTVKVPDGAPPKKLVIRDIKEGDGPEAKSGDLVTVQYVGVDYESGEQFDASWDRGEPFRFQLGAGGVIQGWDQGVEGMKVGGRRELIIPPDLAYGPAGSPPAIGPNATLAFVVDLLAVE